MKLNFTLNRFFLTLFVVLFFAIEGFSQCSITTSRNTTGLSCGTSPLNACGGVLYIGDGTNLMTLTMTSNVNLTCLGPIRFIVRNGATIDFSSGNYDLQLADGSSIEIESGGQIGAGSNCSASDLIKIGSTKVASCNGSGGALTSFPGLVNNGGFSSVTASASPSSFCDSGSSTLTATASPSSGATLKWYDSQTGGNLLNTGSTYNIGPITSTKTYYVEAVYSSYTTVRKAVTVTVNNPTVANAGSDQTVCGAGTNGITLAANAVGTGETGTWTYTGAPAITDIHNPTTTVTLAPGTSSTFTWTITKGSCSTSDDVIITNKASSSISGTLNVCVGSTVTLSTSQSPTNTGNWSSSNTAVATVTSGGVVTGVSAGTVVITYVNTLGCPSTAIITVTAANTITLSSGVGTNNQTSCISTALTNITFGTTGATGATVAGLPAGVTGLWASNVVTISGTPTVSGSFPYTVTLTGGCGTVTAIGTITVNSLSTPTAGTPTNPTCKVPTGSVVLSNLPSSGTIVQTGERSDDIVITTGGSQTITGLLPGTYYFAVDNGSCTSATVSVIIATPENNTWSSGSWSNGTPTINQRLVFASDYTNANDVDLVGCSCQVTGSVAVTIKSGRTLKIENGVDVANTASLTFENDASLVQINDDAENTGNINYKRHTAPVKRYDFTYWSSPVAPQTLKALSPNTLGDKYYSYNPNTGWKIEYNGAANMVAGNGYIIRAPQTFSTTVASIDTNPTFIGVPNNGVINMSITGDKAYLLGNPYPSAIDADAFLDANSTVLEGTLYFWTHNSPPSNAVAGDAIYNYTTNDYATYNRTGGVGTRVSTAEAAATGGAVPTGKIAAGQAFFAPSTGGGTLLFNNSMRVEGGVSGTNNSQFFKLSTTAKESTAATTTREKNRVWLNLTNTQGAFKQTLIGYITGATNNYDNGFDGESYDGNAYIDFYSINNDVNLTIQARALPFVKKDSVTLGYKSTIKGEFQISIDHTDGALATQNIFLEDKDLQVLHDLKKEPYAFSTEKGVFNNRFVLRYVDKNAVEEVIEPETPEVFVDNEVLVSVLNDAITINAQTALLDKINIYDASGKLIYLKDKIEANVYVVPQLTSSHQVLVVTILLSDGTEISRKIVY